MQNGQMHVPDQVEIPFIIGDGIGPDLWKAAVNVFDSAINTAYGSERKIHWKEVLAGEKAFDLTGDWLPAETLDILRTHLVSIKGPLTTPVGGGIRSLNVALRKALDLYVCLRPTRWYQGVPSPVKHPEKVDMTIFRENTEDIYSGIEFSAGSDESKILEKFLAASLAVDYSWKKNTALGVKIVSKEGSERLIRAAIEHAINHQKPSVTIVHKGNIMKYTEGAFKQWGYDLALNEFKDQTFSWDQWEKIKADQGQEAADLAMNEARNQGKVIIQDIIADNFLQQILLNPQNFSVIATLNLNGDYISDSLAAIVGGIGIAPGANINYLTGHAIFEATHGTAPRFANTDTMNPSSLILSGVMMLEYMGWQEAADLIASALQKTIMDKTITIDFYEQMSDGILLKTSEFGKAIVSNF